MSSGVVCPNTSFRIPVVLFASAIIIAFFQWNITSVCLKISFLGEILPRFFRHPKIIWTKENS
jgi:hypothetical protein